MAAVQVLGDLLADLDRTPPRERLLSLVQGVLAANIFDWGAQVRISSFLRAESFQSENKTAVQPLVTLNLRYLGDGGKRVDVK